MLATPHCVYVCVGGGGGGHTMYLAVTNIHVQHVHTCIHMYMYVHIHMYMYVHIHMYMYVHVGF